LEFAYDSLEDYLAETEHAEFAADDPLFGLTRSWRSLTIPRGAVLGHRELHEVLSRQAPPDAPCGAEAFLWLRGEGGVLPLDHPAFANAPHEPRCLVPFVAVRGRVWRTIGFALLDNPYPHFTEMRHTPGLARMVCDLFAPHLANRGMGTRKWLQDIQSGREDATRLRDRLGRDSPRRSQVLARAEDYFRHRQERS
jgi:hypothetical protein